MAVPKKAYLMVAVALSLTACLLYAHMIKASSPVGLRLAEFPMEVDGWRGQDQPYPDWLPETLTANEFFIRKYRNGDGQTVTFYVAYFDARYGGTTHNPNICYPANGWEIAQQSRSLVQLGGRKTAFTEMHVQKGFAKELVLFYFQMGERTFPGLSQYRRAAMVQGIIFNKIGGALVQISAPVGQAVEDTYAVERDFLNLVGPLLENYLPE